jgi:DNA-binding MarR family transcriptional regulator
MEHEEQNFFNLFTDLQCFILANMNKGDIQGVTATHYNIIEFVSRKGCVTAKQIAVAFNVSQAAISKQLKFLIEHELILQEQYASDKRVFNLKTTDKGDFIVHNSENFREKVSRQVSAILSRGELESLNILLHKVLNNLQK